MTGRDDQTRGGTSPGGRPIVGYLHATDGVPPRVGRSWDIITAGDGVWLATDNPALALRVPVAPGIVGSCRDMVACRAYDDSAAAEVG